MGATKETTSRCSVCGNTGHTKMTCTKHLMKRKPVFVRTQQKNTPLSAHVVRLRVDEQQEAAPVVKAFAEKPVKKETRVTIDFASMVQQGNTLPRIRPAVKASLPLTKVVASPVVDWAQPEEPLSHKSQTKDDRSWTDKIAAGLALFGERMLHTQLAPAMIVVLVCIGLSFPASRYVGTVRASTEEIAGISTAAFESLGMSTFAIFQSDLTTAELSLNDALNQFHEASSLLEERHQLLQSVASLLPVIGPHIESRYALLQAGQHISLANTYLLKGIEQTQHSEAPLSTRFDTLITHLRAAKPQYTAALTALASVDTNTLPVSYHQSFEELQLLFGTFVEDVDDIIALSETINDVVGAEGFRRYLLVTQNSAEIRATGGFWGAAAVCDFQQGKFLGCDVMGGGLYDLQGQYSKYYIPPTPMQVVNKRWECHDMNWWPDFSASAELLASCYQDASGRTVDGVIAINGSVLERILNITGPIYVETHGITVASDSALETLQFAKQGDQPKAILGDILEEILSYQYDELDLLRFMTALNAAATEKEIQAFFYDETIQSQVASFGWSGELVDVPDGHDYLMVVNSNLLGEKSDARITQIIDHQAVINDDGTIDVTVLVKREHHGSPDEAFFGRTNLDYIRFYVPEGATLREAGGFRFPPEEYFLAPESWYDVHPDVAAVERDMSIDADSGTEISVESGKTVFGNWMITEPETTSEAYVVYRLPFGMALDESFDTQDDWAGTLFPHKKQTVSRYSVYLEKQSGVHSDIRSRVIYPSYWQPVWKSSDELTLATNGATREGEFERDIQYGIVMTHRKQ